MRRLMTPALFAVTGLLLAGCGSAIPDGAIDSEALRCPPGSDCYDPVQPVGPGGELVIDMDEFSFEVLDGLAITGDVVVTVVNSGQQYHNAVFIGAAEGSDIPANGFGNTPGAEADPGEEGTATVKLFPGEVTFFCDVPGHRSAGMEATIRVFTSEEDAEAAQEAGEFDVEDAPEGGDVGAETQPEEGAEDAEPEDDDG